MRNRAVIVLLAFVSACAPTRFVKPLAKGEHVLSASAGGPLLQYAGAYFPMPLTTICYGHGLTDRVTPFVALHTTSALFGLLQNEIGACVGVLRRERWGISATPALQTATSLVRGGGARLWPSGEGSAWLDVSPHAYVYAGASAWLETHGKRAHGEEQPRPLLPSLQTGYVVRHARWVHQVQASWIGVGIPNLPNVVPYAGIRHRGALGLHYSISFTL